jgi:hypothetical protein
MRSEVTRERSYGEVEFLDLYDNPLDDGDLRQRGESATHRIDLVDEVWVGEVVVQKQQVASEWVPVRDSLVKRETVKPGKYSQELWTTDVSM